MIISNPNYSLDTLNVGGELMTFFLIASIITYILLEDTKFWNKYISNIIDMCSNPLVMIFVMIFIFKIMLAI